MFRTVPGSVTHGDTPGTFTVGFVGVGEALAADKARLFDQVSSTVEHRPEIMDTETLVRTSTRTSQTTQHI